MNTPGSVSVGHGPGAPHNEGTAADRGTPVPDSNLTEIDATQEPGAAQKPASSGQQKPPAQTGATKQAPSK